MADTLYLKDNLTGFVPVEETNSIMELVTRGSSVMKLSKVEPMASDTKQFEVMVSGPGAYWVGETERIKTSVAQWIFPRMTAKKLAVIIPTTKEKMKDTTIDVFNSLKKHVAEAFYRAIDGACLFGTNSPFAQSIYSNADTKGMKITLGTNTSLDLDVSDLMALVEAKDEAVNGFVTHNGTKNTLRKLRDGNGNELYVTGVNGSELYGEPIEFMAPGTFDTTKCEMIAGNWDYSLIGLRDGIEYEVLKESTLFSVEMSDGKPLSLAENDMIALKCTMRLGFLPIKDTAFSLLVNP